MITYKYTTFICNIIIIDVKSNNILFNGLIFLYLLE